MKEEMFANFSSSLSSEEREKLCQRDAAILANRSQVYWLAKRFKVSDDVYQELVREGLSALCRAADNFSHDADSHFTTYAYYKIRSAMLRHLEERRAETPFAAFAFEEHSGLQDDLVQAKLVASTNEDEVIRSFMLQRQKSLRMGTGEKLKLVSKLLLSKLKAMSLSLLPKRS